MFINTIVVRAMLIWEGQKTEASFRVTSLETQLSFPRTLVQAMFEHLIHIHDWADIMLVEREIPIISHIMNSLLFILT